MLDSCELERMFEHFLKEEQLEDLFTCEKCKTKRKSNKKFQIWRVPKILVIHLKRFHFGKTRREKIRQNVIFPVEGLDLKPFIEDLGKIRNRGLNNFVLISGSVNKRCDL